MKVRLNASGFELGIELEKYTNTKISQLIKQVPRKLRANAVCVVHFGQVRRKRTEFNTCSVTFTLDGTELKAEETTLHMYSALDVAAVHISHQLKDYVAKQAAEHRLKARLKRYFRPDR